jgi:hypothetical protein
MAMATKCGGESVELTAAGCWRVFGEFENEPFAGSTGPMLTDANGESKKINFSTRGNRRLVRSPTPALQFFVFRDNPADSELCNRNLVRPVSLPCTAPK